jgi:hypothetical protein
MGHLKGQTMENFRSVITSSRGPLLLLLVGMLLVSLPVAVWLDLRNLTETALLRQAREPQFGGHQHARLLRQ